MTYRTGQDDRRARRTPEREKPRAATGVQTRPRVVFASVPLWSVTLLVAEVMSLVTGRDGAPRRSTG